MTGGFAKQRYWLGEPLAACEQALHARRASWVQCQRLVGIDGLTFAQLPLSLCTMTGGPH